MNKHDKTLKRIHGLFAAKKTPTSLTKDERKVLQAEHADFDEKRYKFIGDLDQKKTETTLQTYSRFEKSMLAALKEVKATMASGKMEEMGIIVCSGYEGSEIEVSGTKVASDDELIKEARQTWEWQVKEAQKKDAAKEAAAKIAEQNALIEELASLLRKPKTKDKKSSASKKKTTKTSK